MPHPAYWLIKTEPRVYSIDDLKRDRRTGWSGVRNYQARGYLREKMKVGDLCLFYHATSMPIGVAGVARVYREAYPDRAALDRKGDYYDPKATEDNPIWVAVGVEFIERFPRLLPVKAMRKDRALKGLMVVQRGQKPSVQPVSRKHFFHVLKLARMR